MVARESNTPRHATGRIRRVARVPADDVPAAYPFSVDASHALALVVVCEDSDASTTGHDGGDAGDVTVRADGDADSETVRVFEAWPSGGHSGSRLARLLDAVGEPTADPDALRGKRVVLESQDGSFRVDVDRTRRRRERAKPASVDTHSLAEVAIVAGALAGLLAFSVIQTAYGWAAAPLAGVAVVVLALSLGFDARRTEDATWSPRALPWAAGGAVPVLNVAVATAYLAKKTVVVDEPDDADHVWRDVLVGGTVVFAGGLALAAFDPVSHVGATVFVHAWALAPVAVFLDGRTDRHGDDPPSRVVWVAGATVLGGAGALIYLLRTDIA